MNINCIFAILELMYKKLSSKVIFSHPRLVVEEDEIILSSGEKTKYLRYGYVGNGVVIVARNNNSEILFIKEYSYVPNCKLLKLPMGKLEQNESIESAANRELQEETKYKATTITKIGSFLQNHRRSLSKGYVVEASELIESALPEEAEELDIEIVWLPIASISKHIQNSDIVDTDTLSSLRICGM